MTDVQERYEAARAEWAGIDVSLKAAIAERDGLTDRCDACNRPFDNAEQVAEHRAALDAKIVTLQEQLADAARRGEELRAERDAKHEEEREAARLAQEQERERARIHQQYQLALASHEDAVRRNVEAQEQVAALQEAAESAAAALTAAQENEPADPILEIRSHEAVVEEVGAAVSEARVKVATLTASIAGIEASIQRTEGDLARAQEKAEEIKVTEQHVLTLDVAAKEMAAMKERLIGRIIPTLEQRASLIVAELTDGKHTEVRLTPDYEMQFISERGELRSFGNLSGGAQNIFALALRLAIAEVRAGDISFLCLDEVFESLDEDRQLNAWDAISRLIKRYEQVLLVTHVANLKERATNLILL